MIESNFDPERSKYRIMGPLSLGAGALGLASSIYGGIKSAQANKQFENQINAQEDQAQSFFNNRVNRDFMETNAAKGVVEELRKRYLDQAKTIDSQTAATGGTAEANIAAKGNLNENYNSAMNNVAQQATGYQEAAENKYDAQISDIAKQRMILAEKKAQNATNLIQGGGALMGTAADLGALGEPTKLGVKVKKNSAADFGRVFPDNSLIPDNEKYLEGRGN